MRRTRLRAARRASMHPSARACCCTGSAISSRRTRSGWPNSKCATTASCMVEMLGADEIHAAAGSSISAGLPTRSRARVLPIDKPGMLELHAPRAARGGRGHHALELAADAGDVEARAGARRGQHHRHQAVRIRLGVRAGVRAAVREGGLPEGRRQRRHRLRRRNRRARSSRIPLWRRIAFTGGDVRRPRVYRGRGRRTSSGSRSNSAANRPTSCSPMPSIENAVKGAISGIFAAPARPASPARGCWCIARSTTSSSSGWSRSAKTAASAIPTVARDRRSVRSRRARSAKGARLHRHRRTGGRSMRARRRRATAPGMRRRLVRRADDLRRRHQRHAHRARGSVRPGAVPSSSSSDEDEAMCTSPTTRHSGSPPGCGPRISAPRDLACRRRLRGRHVWVNTYRAVSYLSPFGGYKQSGIGRENGQEAIHEYLQTKSVFINPQPSISNPFTLQ